MKKYRDLNIEGKGIPHVSFIAAVEVDEETNKVTFYRNNYGDNVNAKRIQMDLDHLTDLEKRYLAYKFIKRTIVKTLDWKYESSP